MTEFTENKLRQGYTFFISKNHDKPLKASYQICLQQGIIANELPKAELRILKNFPNIINSLSEGALLQVHALGGIYYATLGNKKTEGPYCEKEYLEVIDQVTGFSYYELLTYLDINLAEKNMCNIKEYKKLYKGEKRYE